ncbi:MAG: metallophosphoesterase [Legionellales bacterium]
MNLIKKILILLVCFASTAFAGVSFLTLSDFHYGPQNTSEDGHDTGDKFLAVALDKAKELSKKADFILVLGDLPTHLFGYSAEKEAYEKTVFHGLYAADTLKKPMFYISGNNDSLFGNYQPFEVEGKSPLNFATHWSGACVYCDGLIIDKSHMYSEGYYSSYVIPDNKQLILLVLNSTQWMKTQVLWPKYPNQERDALMQLNWLNEQLKQHQGQQLIIAMHEPPGNNYTGSLLWQPQYLAAFIQLLEQYHQKYAQITLLTSHSHMDEFRKIQLAEGHSIYAYSTPSISRNHHNNPGMKLFQLDQKMRVKNFTTYYTSSTQNWNNEQYTALSSPDAIFPDCQQKTLAHCLDTLSDEQVCYYLAKGLFYGVKSPRVDNKACSKLYRVTSP